MSSSDSSGADTLPKGLGWHELPGTSIGAVDPAGGTEAEVVTGDWSSGVMDQTRHRLILTGGGHGDCENGFYAIQLDGNPAYAFVLVASSADSTSPAGVTYANGSPQTGHTWDSAVFVPAGDGSPLADSYLQFIENEVCPGVDSAQAALDLPMVNVTTGQAAPGQDWKFLAGVPQGYLNEYEGITADYDPVSGLVFMTAPRYSDLVAYDPRANAFTAITSNRATGCDFYCTSVVDPDHQRLYAFGGNNNGGTSWTWWDIAGGTSATGAETDFQTPTGCPTLVGSAPGVDWDPVNHTFVIWNSTGAPSTSSLYTYNPGTTAAPDGTPPGQCQLLNLPGSGPPDAAASNGTYKRFRYSKYSDCFVLVNDAQQNAFIVRTR